MKSQILKGLIKFLIIFGVSAGLVELFPHKTSREMVFDTVVLITVVYVVVKLIILIFQTIKTIIKDKI